MKQRNIPWLGAVVESAFNTLPVLSAVNFLSIVAVLYTSVRNELVAWLPWLNFWNFIAIMCGLALALMVLVYIFLLPSLWGFRGQQMFQYKDKVIGPGDNQDRIAELKQLCEGMGLEVTIKEKAKK